MLVLGSMAPTKSLRSRSPHIYHSITRASECSIEKTSYNANLLRKPTSVCRKKKLTLCNRELLTCIFCIIKYFPTHDIKENHLEDNIEICYNEKIHDWEGDSG
jgi:hypothetical protein